MNVFKLLFLSEEFNLQLIIDVLFQYSKFYKVIIAHTELNNLLQ